MQAKNFVAHRGWRQHYPENTLIAFTKAIETGAVNIELDIQLSADQVPFVFHDASLMRICQRKGLIWEYTAAELDTFSAAESDRLGAAFRDNPMCRLSDIVALLQASPKINAYVEIKEESLAHFGKQIVVDAITSTLRPVASQCVLISFELNALQHAINDGWKRVGAVFDAWPDWQSAPLAELKPEVIFCERKCVPSSADLTALPWSILIYEVGSKAEAEDWFRRGAVAVESFWIGELLKEFSLNTV
ncbi:MAG: glycerophosphoryl diester phosphodiesterase [Zhongshania sp.]|jgi:glycerophosphoryl diester phosphodiesterase